MQRIIGLIDYIRFMLKVDFGTTSVGVILLVMSGKGNYR